MRFVRWVIRVALVVSCAGGCSDDDEPRKGDRGQAGDGGGAGEGVSGEAGQSGDDSGGSASGGTAATAGSANGGDGHGAGQAGDEGSGRGGVAGASGRAGSAGTGNGGASGSDGSGGAAGNGVPGEGGLAGEGSGPGECQSGETRECCREGTMTCTGGVWGACVGGHAPTAESCDGEDDDCNGEVDDGIGTFTCGMGACVTSTAACVGGELGACVPLAPTTSSDGCNGSDDDCDGAVDEDCSSCVHVAPDGDDAAALADGGATPFQNLQPAIDFAASSGSAPKNVCVSVGPTCTGSVTYLGPTTADLTMRNGVSLLAGYESTGWTRCTGVTTRVTLGTGLGVLFPPAIDSETVFDGFALDRAATATTAAVTVDGARGVVLSNLSIQNGPVVANSYGINVVNGADATLFRSTVDGGRGETEAIGVRSVASRVTLEDDTIAGRAVGTGLPGNHAILLDGASGSVIQESELSVTRGDAAARIIGAADSVVFRSNTIRTDRSYNDPGAFAVRMVGCEGSALRIVGNSLALAGFGGTGVVAEGDCRPVIEFNTISISASNANVPSASAGGTGIDCRRLADVPGVCVISRNTASTTAVMTSHVPAPLAAGTGIRCDESCSRISRNTLVGLSSSSGTTIPTRHVDFQANGIWVYRAEGVLIERNDVRAGCTNLSATGIRLSGVSARVQNNVVWGYTGTPTGAMLERLDTAGIRISAEAGQGEFDIHSNSINGGSHISSSIDLQTCTSAGVRYDSGALVSIFRNNRMYAGPCNFIPFEAYGFRQNGYARIFENNSLFVGPDPGDGPLVFLDATTPLDIAAVNQLSPTISSGNINGGPGLGTPVGAPRRDFNGKLRDAIPDIGAIEQ